MNTGMYIGAKIDPQSIDKVVEGIVTIMQQSVDQETIRHGIDALTKLSHIENVSISNVTVTGDRSVEVRVDADRADAAVFHNGVVQE